MILECYAAVSAEAETGHRTEQRFRKLRCLRRMGSPAGLLTAPKHQGLFLIRDVLQDQ